jgi:hypothetical protein
MLPTGTSKRCQFLIASPSDTCRHRLTKVDELDHLAAVQSTAPGTGTGAWPRPGSDRAAENIACFEVRPGIIRTEMTLPAVACYDQFIANGGVPMQRWGTADDIGRGIATLACGDLPYATGLHIDIGGGLQLHRV